jgi:UDP-glucose 4-epimerase
VTNFPQNPDYTHWSIVTGGSGKLGRLLGRAWARAFPGSPALIMTRDQTGMVQWHPDLPMPVLPSCGAVIALWGVTQGSKADLAKNLALAEASQALAEACGAPRVIHLSSAAVYGPGTSLTENAALQPITEYGRSKCAMETRIAGFDQSKVSHCILRLANVVGADSLAPALRVQTKPVVLDRFADGRGPRRSYIGPGDLARLLFHLATVPPSRLPSVVNVAAPRPLDMEALAKAANRPILWRAAPPNAQPEVSLDTTRLQMLLPDLPAPSDNARELITDWQSLESP